MSRVEIGDLILWSAQSRWSPMQFGTVYRLDGFGNPWVVNSYSGHKHVAGTNWLLISRKSDKEDDIPSLDDRIWDEIAEYLKN